MLHKLFSSLRPPAEADRPEAFLDHLVELQAGLYPPPDPQAPFTPTLARRIWLAERAGEAAPTGDLEAFEQVRRGVLAQTPRADELALRWVCDLAGWTAWEQARQQAEGYTAGLRYLELSDTLHLWVQRHPVPGAAEAVLRAIEAYRAALVGGPQQVPLWIQRGAEGLVTTLLRLELSEGTGALGRGHGLLVALVDAAARTRAGAIGRWWQGLDERLLLAVAKAYVPHLREAGRLSDDGLDRTLLEVPQLANPAQLRRPSWTMEPELPSSWRREFPAAVERLLSRAAAGDPDARIGRVLWYYQEYAGLDHVLAACRYLEQVPKKGSPKGWADTSGPLAWVVSLFHKLAPPAAADAERAAALATLQPETLLTAALYAPAWADLLAAPLDWPGLAALARWLKRYGGAPPWAAYQQPTEEEDAAGPGAVDRAAALEAVEAMGEARLRELLKHPVARHLYRDGLNYLQAILGWNAAEVQAGFLKRDKRAVRALGMLPDEGDGLDRYLALRRFAKEAAQFGAQRQASERLAAESGLANLALSVGYDDLAQLEWAMEARLADEVDPATRRWTVGEYSLAVESSATAPVLVERGGKLLKSIPPAVRKAPEYAEVAETREQVMAQFDRVRRRLELAMASGETFDRSTFRPALTTPAGRAMVPRLVLRCWYPGAAEPLDLLDGRTLEGEPFALEDAERVEVVHPLHLAETGRLAAWQRHLVERGLTQPFNQLFRETYRVTSAERTARASSRLGGRQFRFGTLAEQMKRRGWRFDESGFIRRYPGRLTAYLGTSAAPWLGAEQVAETGEIYFSGPLGQSLAWQLELGMVAPLTFSEALRDLDLVTASAAVDRAAPPVSREVVAARAALARALVPEADVDGEVARVAGQSLQLASGAVLGPDGAAVALPSLPTPAGFPYPDPASETAVVVARLLHLARARAGHDS